MSSFPTKDLCPLQEEMEMTKIMVNIIYSLIYVLDSCLFLLDVREQGMGRDTKEPINMSPEVENSLLDQEIVAEAEKQAEGSVRERDEEYPQRTAEGIMVHLLEMEDRQGAQRTGPRVQ